MISLTLSDKTRQQIRAAIQRRKDCRRISHLKRRRAIGRGPRTELRS